MAADLGLRREPPGGCCFSHIPLVSCLGTLAGGVVTSGSVDDLRSESSLERVCLRKNWLRQATEKRDSARGNMEL